MIIRWLLRLFIAGALLFAVAGIIAFNKFAPLVPRLPEKLSQLTSVPATEVYARDGQIIQSLGGREYVTLDRISPHFQNAVIAAEDKRFYSHKGIDHIAFIRILVLNLINPKSAPGGSTITQQLAKNLFFTFERSYKRKAVEALSAMAIENRFDKKQILETYCNLVYYGPYAHGVERAAKLYYNKRASELNLAEASMLAGILNAPGMYDPYTHYERSKARQKVILTRMKKCSMISATAVDSAFKLPIKLANKTGILGRGSYPVDYALEIARANKKVGREGVNYGGIRIFTTLDVSLQQIAERVLADGVADLEKRIQPAKKKDLQLEGALVVIENATGDIRVMVGGRSYRQSEYNRAVFSQRHPGSAIKPLIYLTAIEKLGIHPATLVTDKPVEFIIDKNQKKWAPQNYDRKFRGQITLKNALMQSVNTISAQLIDTIGAPVIVEKAGRLGITAKLQPHLSLSLGAQEVSVLDIATMMATIANEGSYVEPFLVRRIEERGMEVLFEGFSPSESRFAPEHVYQLIDMLRGVVDEGTAQVIRRKGFTAPAIGKTGTAADFRDAWFVGATPNLTVAIWVGYDDNSPLKYKDGRGVTGGGAAAPIWADFMLRATAGINQRDFAVPSGIRTGYMDFDTGELSPIAKEGFIPVALTESQYSAISAGAVGKPVPILPMVSPKQAVQPKAQSKATPTKSSAVKPKPKPAQSGKKKNN